MGLATRRPDAAEALVGRRARRTYGSNSRRPTPPGSARPQPQRRSLSTTPPSRVQSVQLQAFEKFGNTAEALSAATALVDSKLPKALRKFLRAQCQSETLAVADSKLGSIIKDKLGVTCVHSAAVMELMRGVRSHLGELITGLGGQDLAPMSLGLSHSLSRYKLKFSPDKVDTMIVQAIGLLDDLDKELNTYAMRVREWYGWHFPELAKIVTDNIEYAKVVRLMGPRTSAASMDFSEVLSEEVEVDMKEAAVISMGTEVSEQDMANIVALCEQVISLAEYRAQLYDYLRSRMAAIAPNLTVLVGELVGARLIAHAGSLINLAKFPASTVQILGAEKALFRALKTKHETPKYGLIYHASLIGQAPPKLKGKISRSLAAKCALSIRIDALAESSEPTIGLESRAKLEARLRQLEGRTMAKASGAARGKPMVEAYDRDRKRDAPLLLTTAKAYNPAADSTLTVEAQEAAGEARAELKKKKKKKESVVSIGEAVAEAPETTPAIVEPAETRPKKKKIVKTVETEETTVIVKPAPDGGAPVTEKATKKKKERYFEEDAEEGLAGKKVKRKAAGDTSAVALNGGTEIPKKKKKTQQAEL
eukprot:SM000034S12804  [mRNA]  locus=s34:812893:816310:- [translate_table: standard]